MKTRAIAQAKKVAGAAVGRVANGLLQRACACGATPGVDGTCMECRGERLQRPSLVSVSANGGGQEGAPAIVHEVLRSPGQPLDAQTRGLMETRFGQVLDGAQTVTGSAASVAVPLGISREDDAFERRADEVAARAMQPQDVQGRTPRWDFSRVRVHTDARAAQSARAVHALAYTVGDHIVFGCGRFAPQSVAGQHLLAHELAHTAQQQGSRLARQPKQPVKWRPHRPTLPLAKPPPPPRDKVPAGITPCLTGKVCDPPIPGSAWDFGKLSEKASSPRPSTPTPAKETKKAANDAAPGIFKDIFEVTVNPGLAETVAAQVDICKEFNVPAPDASASCIEVPSHVEKEAARFNKGLACVDEKEGADVLLCEDRDQWAFHLVQLFTHEVAHVTFKHLPPAGVSSRTSNEITLHELSELYAQLSEFAVHYRSIVARFPGPGKDRETLETSVKAWVAMHALSTGEGFQGVLTKLRCINSCETVTALVTSVVQAVTAPWPEAVKNDLLQELHDTPKLDWPMPAPIARPQPGRPKFAPLYQRRGTFIPEIEKSLEQLP